MSQTRYPCPCGGFLTFASVPDSFANCLICFWEDDVYGLRFPTEPSSNPVILVEAQRNYAEFGATTFRRRALVRPLGPDDPRDLEWHPIDLSIDDIEEHVDGVDYASTWPEDYTSLYYWRPTYWRRRAQRD